MTSTQGFSLGSLGLAISPPDVETLVGVRGVTEKITLTVDPVEVRDYMGVPLEDSSLVTPEDVAIFCKQSKWFKPEQFTRKFNSENRKRWANRPFYRQFVESVIAEFGYGDCNGVQAGKKFHSIQHHKNIIINTLARPIHVMSLVSLCCLTYFDFAVKGDSTEFVRPVDTSKTCPHISEEDHVTTRRANIEDAVTRCD